MVTFFEEDQAPEGGAVTNEFSTGRTGTSSILDLLFTSLTHLPRRVFPQSATTVSSGLASDISKIDRRLLMYRHVPSRTVAYHFFRESLA